MREALKVCVCVCTHACEKVVGMCAGECVCARAAFVNQPVSSGEEGCAGAHVDAWLVGLGRRARVILVMGVCRARVWAMKAVVLGAACSWGQ